jgi:hypothetical protein
MMSLQLVLDRLEKKIDAFFGTIPKSITISKSLANDLGFKSTTGLRKACARELEPEVEYFKDGKLWRIHTASLWKIKR